MTKIVSSTALRNEYSDLSGWCHSTNEPAIITRNGSGDLVVMSVQAYDEMAARLEMYRFIGEGHREAAEGRTDSARNHLLNLREKYGLQ